MILLENLIALVACGMLINVILIFFIGDKKHLWIALYSLFAILCGLALLWIVISFNLVLG